MQSDPIRPIWILIDKDLAPQLYVHQRPSQIAVMAGLLQGLGLKEPSLQAFRGNQDRLRKLLHRFHRWDGGARRHY